jgi:uncharacterized membrane protein
MKNDLLILRDKLRASYWFIPMIMATFAFALSIIAVQADERWGLQLAWVVGLVYVDSPEGARAVLSTVASSMITVAGVVFSLTMVVLSLTSQQYGPLVLSNFIRDRGNQFVLGTFTGTFIYCLLVLRTIRGVGNSFFIPHISVLIGLGLAIASLAVLIYFIHHVSDSIRASTIITRISADIRSATDELFPEPIGRGPQPIEHIRHELPDNFDAQAKPVYASRSGYLQLVDEGHLLATAVDADVVIKLAHRPGDFVLDGAVLALVWPLERVNEKLSDRINDAFEFGQARTQAQDLEYLLNQLVGVGARALSPALNDPFTAMSCIDRLAEALCRLANRKLPSAYRYDRDGQLRIIANPLGFAEMVRLSFDEVWAYGRGDARVRRQLQKAFDMLAECIHNEDYRAMVCQYAATHPMTGAVEPEIDTLPSQRITPT